MLKIAPEAFKYANATHAVMRSNRQPMWKIWRELADTYLPYRHPWLLSSAKNEVMELNSNYITDVGLKANRVQTAGLMNGITSPTRPWVKLGIGYDPARLSIPEKRWLYHTEVILHTVLARSNFYNTMAMEYFDVGLMGLGGMNIVEDYQDAVRVQRYNTGEFYVLYDHTGRLIAYSREIRKTLRDIIAEFGKDNLPLEMRAQVENPSSQNAKHTVYHFCARDIPGLTGFHSRREWKEIYWMTNQKDGEVLSLSSYREQAALFPRWSAELEYGNAPGIDALASMRELIQLILEKGAGIEKMVKPPMLYDMQLKNQAISMVPGGRTFIPNLANFLGAKPAYQIAIPVGELRADIQEVSESIRETFNNNLFTMISQLDTVRSSREIEARKEEKMVQLSHFLERFENETLDPGVRRVFNMCQRAGLFPDPPRSIANADIDIQYISILTVAQRALNTVPMERVLGLVGSVANVSPNVLDLINFDELIMVYGRDLAANPTMFNDEETVKALRAARQQQEAAMSATATASTMIDAARGLSETDVGGGVSALQKLINS